MSGSYGWPTSILSRREWLQASALGFAGLAYDGIELSASDSRVRGNTRVPHLPPKAKSVIWIFLAGGLSHMESFDPKPMLNKYAGKNISQTPFKDAVSSPLVMKNLDTGFGKMIMQEIYPLQVGFRRRGESGIEISDWWPHLGECADDMAVIRSMWTTDNNHQAQYQFHTGRPIVQGPHPSIGAWVHYGLGTLNENLPQFVVLGKPVGSCCGGNLAHGSDYLGPTHAGVRIETSGDFPVPYLMPELPLSRSEHHSQYQLIMDLLECQSAKRPEDQQLEARIRSYELAFRMQSSVPELVDVSGETSETQNLYGLTRSDAERSSFSRQCLLARRMVERGVRFVQIMHGAGGAGSWDAHAHLKTAYTSLCEEVDQPIAALLKDLKRRGLLDSTLVVLATEFGRTPGLESVPGEKNREGRDHHPYGFSVCMAGGGIKGGVVHGATDDLGFHAVENRHYVTDIHATVLHLLGLDPRRLDKPGRQRIERDYGEPIREVMA